MIFQVRQAGVKGFGVFATDLIRRGTRIIVERPLLSITNETPDILAAAAKLTTSSKNVLLSLAPNDARPFACLSVAVWRTLERMRLSSENRSILNIFYNNNFNLSDAAGTRAIFPTVARINHSCIPNAQGNVNTALGGFTIHALRDIPRNEEISISYLHDELGLPEARQARLQRDYGFVCGCEICSSSSPKTSLSLARRSALRTKSMAFAALIDPSIAAQLALTRETIEVFEQEGMAGRELASLYWVAAGLAMKSGDEGLALSLGAKSCHLERDAVGEDSPFYVAKCEALRERSFDSEGERTKETGGKAEELSYAPWT